MVNINPGQFKRKRTTVPHDSVSLPTLPSNNISQVRSVEQYERWRIKWVIRDYFN